MSALASAYRRRLGCVSTPRFDLDSTGHLTPPGMGCANCYSCDSRIGEMGIAGDGSFRIVRKEDGIKLVWDCPGCGREVTEPTELFSVEQHATEIASDALCVYCRRRAALAHLEEPQQ